MLLKIHGIVQGVGFRPFIHRLVGEYGLKGYIENTSSGVELELEGEPSALSRFVEDLPARAPQLAVIEKMEAEYGLPLKGFEGFTIRLSKRETERNTLISPDICICENCLRELRSPSDRRYRYPFINCTDCGPRFTIIRDIPYDRASTSMSGFPMCTACDREYHDIGDRRYHAQPDCCPDCGPTVFFTRGGENGSDDCCGDDAISAARECILNGGIVAVKGLGGVHLACRCDDPEIIRSLRKRKHRDQKPFAVMCRDVDEAKKLCRIDPDEEKILSGFRRPIVLLKKKTDGSCPIGNEALQEISENGRIGVMLPYTPLHYLLFGEDIGSLIMTSANLSDTPVIYKNEEALEKLKGIADGFLLHNREIVTRCDDSLCVVADGGEYFFRRSRGYVPFPVTSELSSGKRILACGAEQKAGFSMSKGRYVFQSQHIGDLKNMETFEHYSLQISHFEKMFDIVPEALACDLHPDYMSTDFAEQLSGEKALPLFYVQHHHAHMASCMVDNRLQGNVIGLIWDGTGLGTDGTVWGGECLTGGYGEFSRFGTVRPVALIGGDKAVLDIRRVAYDLLREAEAMPSDMCSPEFETMLSAGMNCPLSSGMGRLFDGVASILGLLDSAGYEGQGAVLVEACAEGAETDAVFPIAFYDGQKENGGGPSVHQVFDWRPMIRAIADELEKGTDKKILAAEFMNTIARMGVMQCVSARSETGINRVVLSGGVFQNMVLLRIIPDFLREEGFEVFLHRRVSCNDEGISLGQLAVADFLLSDEKHHDTIFNDI